MPPGALQIFVPILLGIVLLAITLRVVADRLDRARVRGYIEKRGGTVLSLRWRPFGPGWFGEQSQRIYRLRYRDEPRQEREAFVKTSVLTGVYLTEDRPVMASNSTAESELVAENQRLRARIRSLETLLRAQHGNEADALDTRNSSEEAARRAQGRG